MLNKEQYLLCLILPIYIFCLPRLSLMAVNHIYAYHDLPLTSFKKTSPCRSCGIPECWSNSLKCEEKTEKIEKKGTAKER